MDRWVGKIAVVTGASAGIGASIAEKLVHEGLQNGAKVALDPPKCATGASASFACVVVALARRIERLEETAKTLKGVGKGKYIPLKADISDTDDIIRVFDHISKNIGPISILVNNAGGSNKNSLVDGDIDGWKKVLDTNLLGLAVATRQALKSMRDNKIDGHIVNINSTLGHHVPNAPIPLHMYPASKFGVTAFTQSLRYELIALGSKIKTTSLSPGVVDTEMVKASGVTFPKEMMARMKNAPRLKPEDIANSVIFALSTPPHVEVAELTVTPVGLYV